jgi:PAS domain S-box-containing protein
VNSAYTRWAGKQADSIIGKGITEIFGKEVSDIVKMYAETIRPGDSKQFVAPVNTKDGLRPAEFTLTPDVERKKLKGFTLYIHELLRDVAIEEDLQSGNGDADNDKEVSLKGSELQGDAGYYLQLLEVLPAAVYTCDAEGRITWYNSSAARLWGREPEINKDLWCGSWKIFKPDGTLLPLDSCPMAIALKEGRSVFGHEIVVERPDGIRRNVAPHPQPLFDDNGNVRGAINMLVDITPLKRAGQALQESEDRFNTIADVVPIPIWRTDEKGNWMFSNKQWDAWTGKALTAGDLVEWEKLIHPDDRDRVSHEWRQAVLEKKVYSSKFRYGALRNEYRIVHAIGVPEFNSVGEFSGHIGILQDVTLQEDTRSMLDSEMKKRSEDFVKWTEEFRKSEERYHRMIDEIEDYAIIRLNSDGIVEEWNKGAEKIKGYKATEIIGKSFTTFYTDSDRESGLPQRLINEARVNGRATQEGWRVRKDGSRFWGSILITSLHNDDNEVIGFSKITRDLTERKIADDKLKTYAAQLEQKNNMLEKMNQELASFAYVSSHDLQEPLRKIQTFATRILEFEKTLSDKGKDYFARIQASASRMQKLIEDLLAYSRTDTSERRFELTDLNVLLQSVKNELRETIDEKGAVIESVPLPQIRIIPFQFHQLMVNLFSNALKFTRQGVVPHIIIRSGVIKGDAIRVAGADASKIYHHFTVADNGIGFEPEYRTKIFEVFQRLHGRDKYAGTGIGLAICKKIIENHGGVIDAEGQLNQGATFHIYLPM